MRHTIKQNPDWVRPWDEENLKAFLREAREYFTFKTEYRSLRQNEGLAWDSPYRVRPLPRPEKITVVQWLYKLGRDHRVLPMCFEQFEELLVQKNDPYAYARYRQRKRQPKPHEGYELCGPHDEPYRQRQSHAHVEKKVRDEQYEDRHAWREHKQFNRDKSKGKGWFRGCGRKTWAKRYSNRMERRHVRECLHHDRPDEIESHRLFQDKWMWD